MTETLTLEDGKFLLQLCRTGRLYEIAEWIASGKSLRLPAPNKKSVLAVALETGFYSLVELIARNESEQTTKDAALRLAVDRRRLDFVELLLAHGANLKSVRFLDVLRSWDPKVIRLFLENGADALTDLPFAHAFREKVRTAIAPFLEYKRAQPGLAAQLDEQADCALRYFCSEGNLKWVSLMLWIGANARTNGPSLDERFGEDPECFTTALDEAAYAENVEILKKCRPEAGRDDLVSLLGHAAVLARTDTVIYLLGLGANPNDKENGGSSALESCLKHMSSETFNPYHQQRSKYQVSRTLSCVQALLGHGAKWKPDEPRELNYIRRSLYECEPAVTIEVLQLFQKHDACSQEAIRDLLRPSRMKEHLASHSWHLARLKLSTERPNKRTQREPPPPGLLARFNREELYEKVWAEPMRTVAKSYGTSDVWLGKVCKVLRVPVPGRGYWAKKYAGANLPKRPPLPAIPKPSPDVVLHTRSLRFQK